MPEYEDLKTPCQCLASAEVSRVHSNLELVSELLSYALINNGVVKMCSSCIVNVEQSLFILLRATTIPAYKPDYDQSVILFDIPLVLLFCSVKVPKPCRQECLEIKMYC